MPTNLSPWSRRLWKMLAAGPQAAEHLYAEAGAMIPPGVAWRKAESDRLDRARRRGSLRIERVQKKEVDEILRRSRRRSLYQIVSLNVRMGKFEYFFDDEGERWVRLTKYGKENPPQELRYVKHP